MAERDWRLAEHKQKSHLLHAAEHMGWAAKALAAGVEPVRSELDLGGAGEGRAPKAKPIDCESVYRRAKRRCRMILLPAPCDDPILAAEQEDMYERMAALLLLEFTVESIRAGGEVRLEPFYSRGISPFD